MCVRARDAHARTHGAVTRRHATRARNAEPCGGQAEEAVVLWASDSEELGGPVLDRLAAAWRGRVTVVRLVHAARSRHDLADTGPARLDAALLSEAGGCGLRAPGACTMRAAPGCRLQGAGWHWLRSACLFPASADASWACWALRPHQRRRTLACAGRLCVSRLARPEPRAAPCAARPARRGARCVCGGGGGGGC